MRKIQTDVSEPVEVEEKNTYRPKTLDEYIGQERVKKAVKIAINSAKARNVVLEHILFYGPPGLGKTTLANIIAEEMQAEIVTVVGGNIEKPGDVAGILCRLKENSILFVDEIHRMPKPCEEMFYSAMEDGFVCISVGVGEQAKQIKIELPPFTLIGATTNMGMMSAPLQDRFMMECKLDYYTDSELAEIVKSNADKMNMEITEEQAYSIAEASRETPRIAIRNLKMVRDYAYSEYDGYITDDCVRNTFALHGIRKDGIDETDLQIFDILSSGKAVGLSTLSHTLGEDVRTIEEVKEPYLLRKQYISKTPKGRVLTEKGKLYCMSLTAS